MTDLRTVLILTLIDWLILTACQIVLGCFMPSGQIIAYDVSS